MHQNISYEQNFEHLTLLAQTAKVKTLHDELLSSLLLTYLKEKLLIGKIVPLTVLHSFDLDEFMRGEGAIQIMHACKIGCDLSALVYSVKHDCLPLFVKPYTRCYTLLIQWTVVYQIFLLVIQRSSRMQVMA